MLFLNDVLLVQESVPTLSALDITTLNLQNIVRPLSQSWHALFQEHRILTPILFSLLLLIVFFVWVNVIIAIISEVYDKECERSMTIFWDKYFPSMQRDVLQPENDAEAMKLHKPVHTIAIGPTPDSVQLTPDRFAFWQP
jgi:hypothetical protein